jgi:hypothetical protein
LIPANALIDNDMPNRRTNPTGPPFWLYRFQLSFKGFGTFALAFGGRGSLMKTYLLTVLVAEHYSQGLLIPPVFSGQRLE